MSDTTIDFKRWLDWRKSETDFEQRRERVVRYENYQINFKDIVQRVAMITTDLPKYRTKAKPGGLFTSTRRRLWDAMDWLSLQYSAGAPVDQLAEVWPHTLDWAEEYAQFHEAYHQTPEANNYVTPHATLRDEEYWIVALRLVCFGLMSSYGSQMPRVMAFLDYGNKDMDVYDGLLERLVAPWCPGRPTPPDTATRHLPYRKLFKVFDAAPEQRPALMAKYLDEWYEASRREPYIDRHDEGGFTHYGYWSWEAGATTVVLGIDDATYRDMPFYPRDWVDYARSLQPAGDVPAQRVASGRPCPRTGWWFTPAKEGSRRHFKQGDVFPDVEGSNYGATFWQWSPDQSDPSLQP